MAFSSLFRRKSTTTILQQGGDGDHAELHKVLTVKDLTFLGLPQSLVAEPLAL